MPVDAPRADMHARINFSRFSIVSCMTCLGFSALHLLAPIQIESLGPVVEDACPRPQAGSEILEPVDLRSENGVLRVDLTFQSVHEAGGQSRFCYVYGKGIQSPNLRVRPGDTLILTLKNDATLPQTTSRTTFAHLGMPMDHPGAVPSGDPCSGGIMTQASTNLHFHGMVISPTCHQDETIKTLLEPGSVPFEYRIQIPKDQTPGLYWYHPHPHGFSEQQVLGGASGALIVEGIEKVNHLVSSLPERILIIRDQPMLDASVPSRSDPKKPTKDISLNYVPIRYPELTPAIIQVRPERKELWRVLNASADTFVDLALVSSGKTQSIGLIALDGVPEGYDEGNADGDVVWKSHVLLPPAGRAEFIVTTPPLGSEFELMTRAVPRGPLFDPDNTGSRGTGAGQADQDDNDPSRPLAIVHVSADASDTQSVLPKSPERLQTSQVASLASIRPVRTRKFYFSEELVDPQDPRGPTRFYITEEGHTPKVFDPKAAPDVVVHQGDVEDWIVENRSHEPHTFHIHQIHFLVIQRFGGPYEDLTLRDTISIPYWDGFSKPYPSAKLRMDFRGANIIGTFPYHCHILQHEDGGMMGSIRVEPAIGKQ